MTTLGPVTETNQIERSLVLVKPDGFRRGLTGEVIRRIEAKGYTLAALAVLTPTREQLAAHYAEHEGKPFYEPLLEFMASGPVAAVVIEGQECIPGFRSLAGATKPTEAAPRHDPWRPGPQVGRHGRREHRARVRLARVGCPRDRHLVPRPLT